MAYDNKGRWVPIEKFDWNTDRDSKVRALEEAGLDWESGDRGLGINVFRTGHGMPDPSKGQKAGAWANMSEEQRFEVLQEYDNWYDGLSDNERAQLDLSDSWGMDLYRGVTYDVGGEWDAKSMFHKLVGLETDNSPGNQIDYNAYNESHLWRGIIDNIAEDENLHFQGKPLFNYERDPINNTAQIRAGNEKLREWADEKGGEYEPHLGTQVIEGAHPDRREFTENWQRNQAVRLERWKPWYTFDEQTGIGYHKDIHSGEILDTVTFDPPPPPQRVQLTSDKALEDQENGIFYTGLKDGNEKILAGIPDEPGMPRPPRGLNLQIKRFIPSDQSRKYMNIENHPYLGEPEPPNSAANKIEVVEDGI